MDAYALVTEAVDADGMRRWGYEARIAQEGMDPSDAGDTELLSSGPGFATRHAAEVAAFSAAYALIDKLIGPTR
jgi:hypothetical protein